MGQSIPSDEQVDRDIAMEDYRADIQEVSDRLKYQVDFALAALRNLQLVNGGGIIALLTFIGNASANVNLDAIWWAFFWFCCGLFTSLACYLGAYFSQDYFMNVTSKQAWNAQARARGKPNSHDFSKDIKWGNRSASTAIVMAVLSLISFAIGSFVALSALK